MGTIGTSSGLATQSASVTPSPSGSRKHSRAGQSASSLTRKNVEALQANLGTSLPDDIKGDGRIIQMSYDRIVEPVQAAARSAQSSAMDRQIRKNRLVNRMNSISNMF